MASECSYCGLPISGKGLVGRANTDQGARAYCCYGCLSLGEDASTASSSFWNPALAKLLLGLFLAGQAMVLSLAVNLTSDLDSLTRQILQILVLTATVIVIAMLGFPMLGSALGELRRGRVTIELLFLASLGGAFAASMQAFLAGTGPIYFEVVAILLVVYEFGRQMGGRRRASATAEAQRWTRSLATARALDGRLLEVANIRPGDTIEVRPGELIAVDGIVRLGTGFVSEAPITGEPFASVKRPEDRVLAGSASCDALFHIQATAPGTARQIDQLLASVEAARGKPGSLTRQADRLGQIFLPVILIAAGITFTSWTAIEGWRTGLFNAMSVLLVACPCAIGLATPIVVWSVFGRLAQRGLIVRDGDALERLAEVDHVIFDKTGTLSEEQPALVDLVISGDRDLVRGWLALVQSRCVHPVARAFEGMAEPRGEIESLHLVPGCGVDAQVRDEAGIVHSIRLGRPAWLHSDHRPEAQALRDRLHATHGQRVDVEIDGRIAAIGLIQERLRDSASDALRELRQFGMRVDVWTGDTAERAAALGFPQSVSGMLPDDKRIRIQKLEASGAKTLFVGDGVNDAGALAVAHAGVALATGAELAHCAATATLYHGDLRVIPFALATSRDAVNILRRTLWRAGLYNLIAILLAAFGMLHPVVAALLMVASSALVAWSASRAGCEHQIEIVRPRPALGAATVAHALALALQGPLWVQLLDLQGRMAAGVVAGFGIIALIGAFFWRRWTKIPHHLDMAWGMLTLGNAGMLLGWWADAGFAPLCPVCPCSCSPASHPFMWLGMMVGSNLAMAGLARQAAPMRWRELLAGNLGMAAGMALGAQVAPATPVGHFLGMTLGMLLGMSVGHEGSALIPVSARQLPRRAD